MTISWQCLNCGVQTGKLLQCSHSHSRTDTHTYANTHHTHTHTHKHTHHTSQAGAYILICGTTIKGRKQQQEKNHNPKNNQQQQEKRKKTAQQIRSSPRAPSMLLTGLLRSWSKWCRKHSRYSIFMYTTMFQCTGECCSVLQCVAVCCIVLQTAQEMLKCVAVGCSMFQCVAECYMHT